MIEKALLCIPWSSILSKTRDVIKTQDFTTPKVIEFPARSLQLRKPSEALIDIQQRPESNGSVTVAGQPVASQRSIVWSPEEDEAVVSAIETHGMHSWKRACNLLHDFGRLDRSKEWKDKRLQVSNFCIYPRNWRAGNKHRLQLLICS